MRREDYERKGPPTDGNRTVHVQEFYVDSVTGAIATEVDGKRCLGIHGRTVALLVNTKEGADYLIQALIAIRNHIWKEP